MEPKSYGHLMEVLSKNLYYLQFKNEKQAYSIFEKFKKGHNAYIYTIV
jgi:hypothetical protein